MTARALPTFLKFVSALAIFMAGAALLPLSAPAQSANVVGSIHDVMDMPFGGQFNTIQFTPTNCPQRIGTNTYWPQTRTARLTNGVFSVNLVPGFYFVGLVGEGGFGQVPKTARMIVPPGATNTLQFNDCANLASNVWQFSWAAPGGATSKFTATITNLASVPFQIVVTTNNLPATNVYSYSPYVTVSNSTNGIVSNPTNGYSTLYGNYGYYDSTDYVGTNRYNFSWSPASGGTWLIYAFGPNVSYHKTNSALTNLAGFYDSTAYGITDRVTVTYSTGSFSFSDTSTTTNILTTNVIALADTFHYNLTTYTNGIAVTNIFQ
jgi:hypothetical protein